MKPELVVISGPHAGMTLDLAFEGEFFIGRSSSAQLRLKADKKISQLHAKLVAAAGSFVLHDLGSTNGTYHNGEKIDEVRIESGDRIKVGYSLFVYRTDAEFIDPSDLADIGSAGGLETGAGADDEGQGDYLSSEYFRLGLLSKLSRAVIETGDAFKALNSNIGRIARAVGASRAVAFIFDRAPRPPREVANFSFSSEGKSEPVDAEVMRRVVSQAEYVRDESKDSVPCAVPLLVGGAVVGCFYLDAPLHARTARRDERLLLETIANFLSVSLLRERQRVLAESMADGLELAVNLGERCAIEVREAVARLLELYRESIAGRDLTLSFEVADGLTACAEPQLLDRALAGVLAYSVEGATRDLKVAGRFALEGHCIELTISYDGEGFDPGSAEFSFDQEGLRRDLGVALDRGLAGRLALIRCAVELAGGRLTHDSRGPGQGARFVVLLPLLERTA